MINPEVNKTLDECVAEVLAILTGQDLEYQPELDRYQVICRFLNMAVRRNALDHEWSYYSSVESIGKMPAGTQEIYLRPSIRPRLIGGDSLQLRNSHDQTILWAYSMARDEIAKYVHRRGLWYSPTRSTIYLSRALNSAEAELEIWVPVMREPIQFKLPSPPVDPDVEFVVPAEVREQPLDFDYPDVVIARAAYMYSLADPVMQPRAQTLESEYKDLMYQLVERDTSFTDTPFQNEWVVPIMNSIDGGSTPGHFNTHPHADERGWSGH